MATGVKKSSKTIPAAKQSKSKPSKGKTVLKVSKKIFSSKTKKRALTLSNETESLREDLSLFYWNRKIKGDYPYLREGLNITLWVRHAKCTWSIFQFPLFNSYHNRINYSG